MATASGFVAYIWLVEVFHRFIAPLEIGLGIEVFWTGNPHTPKLAAHQTFSHLLKVTVCTKPLSFEVMAIDFIMQLLANHKGKIVMAVDKWRLL